MSINVFSKESKKSKRKNLIYLNETNNMTFQKAEAKAKKKKKTKKIMFHQFSRNYLSLVSLKQNCIAMIFGIKKKSCKKLLRKY